MDSASPIAFRTAGQPRFETGARFTFAMDTNKAENVATTGLSGPYRDDHRRPSHGEDRPA